MTLQGYKLTPMCLDRVSICKNGQQHGLFVSMVTDAVCGSCPGNVKVNLYEKNYLGLSLGAIGPIIQAGSFLCSCKPPERSFCRLTLSIGEMGTELGLDLPSMFIWGD